MRRILILLALTFWFWTISQMAEAQVKLTSLEYHQKLQKQNNWKTYQSNRIKRAKKNRKLLKDQEAYLKWEEKIIRKVKRIEN